MKLFREEPIVCLIILMAVALRIFALENIPGVLGDEAWGFTQVQLFAKNLDYTFSVPSGRWFNPIYGLIVFISRATEPFWMRLPSFLIGSGILALTYLLFKKLYGQKSALLITAIVACFPPHIHYSRLAWDCCFIPLFSLLLTYLPLKKNYVGTLIAAILSFWIHPSLTFLALPGLLLFLNDRKEAGRPVPKITLILLIPTLVLLAIIYFIFTRQIFYFPTLKSSMRFTLGVFDFFTGTIVSQDPLDKRIISVVIAFGVFLLALIILKAKQLQKREKIFLVGSGLTILVLFLLRGVWAIFPGHERTILYLGIPFCLFLSLLLQKRGVLFLTTFYLFITLIFYFTPSITSGGYGVQTKTGPEDPKYSAIRWIVSQHKNQGPLRIIAEDWGIYWSSFNYALGNSSVAVEMKRVNEQPGFSSDSKIADEKAFENFLAHDGYAIGFRGGNIDRMIFSQTINGIRYSRIGFKDYSGEDYIYVWVRESN